MALAQTVTLGERFWGKVQKSDACWEWQASTRQGYGQLAFEGRVEYAHRVSWIMHIGPIPKGMCVLHRCDNRPCIRPDHLFLGTKADNMADMDAKGRRARYFPPRPTHCKNGHPFDEENTYVDKKRGWWSCRICRNDYQRARWRVRAGWSLA